MGTHNRHAVRIAEVTGESILSPAQKRFNSLIKTIEKQHELLALWQDTLPRIQQKVASEYDPALEILDRHRGEFVVMLDNAYHARGLKKSERSKLSSLILEMCEDLLTTGAHEHLKPIYDRHTDTDFDAKSAMAGETMTSMVNKLFGFDLPDDADTSSPEKLAAAIQAHALEMEAAAEQRYEADRERRSKRKKNKKQLEKEAQQQKAEAGTSASIRDIYRKLVAALHPDREKHAAERERKTAMMQEVNAAYTAKNLLRLLQLQLKVEQIDQTAINAISEERLKHYNLILKEQSAQLQEEIQSIEMEFVSQDGSGRYTIPTPLSALKQLSADIQRIKRDTTAIKKDLRELKDIKQLKAWLRYQDPYDEPGFDEFF